MNVVAWFGDIIGPHPHQAVSGDEAHTTDGAEGRHPLTLGLPASSRGPADIYGSRT